MNQSIIQTGMLLVFVGIIVIFIGALFTTSKDSNVKFSIFGLFGFIPFGFSNDKRLFYFSIIITALLAVFTILFFYRTFR